jgi:hypothetical protein
VNTIGFFALVAIEAKQMAPSELFWHYWFQSKVKPILKVGGALTTKR